MADKRLYQKVDRQAQGKTKMENPAGELRRSDNARTGRYGT